MDEPNKKIAIVGAGLSGLLACKYALSKGFHPLVFESQATIGGVWTTPLETTRLQTPKPLYQFSDFPWPESVCDKFPSHDQVMDYIRSYAEHFDLVRHVRFNSKVVGIEYTGGGEEMEGWESWGGNGEAFGKNAGKWELTVEDSTARKNGAFGVEVHVVDFVVLAIGRFSGVPNIPGFPPCKGPEVFRGEVIHSMDYAAMDFESAHAFVKGRRVVVVGVQKSAVDVAVECSTANGAELPCTVVYRKDHWKIPVDLPWSIVALLYFNRFAELLLHKPGEGWLTRVAADVLSPLRLFFSMLVESYLKWKLPLKKFGMIPTHSFLEDLSGCVLSTVPEKFFHRIEEGSIKLRKSQNISFCRDGVLVDGSDSPLEADVVIFATGFKGDEKLREIFRSPNFRQRIVRSQDGSVPLYRQVIHPSIPQLAVIGFSESLLNLYTSEIRCRWLFEFLAGAFKLPSMKEMEQEVLRWNTFLKRYSSHDNYRRSCIAILHIWYSDQLCKDMGWNPRRKRGFLTDLFEPYGPLDYASP